MDNQSRCPYCQTALPAEAMQGVCPRCLGFMILGLPSEGGEEWVVAEQPGDRIGPYKLLEQVGQGGCGVVLPSRSNRFAAEWL